MKEHIHHLLEQTVANLKSAGVLPADLEARVQVDRCKEKAHGDLATNLAMLLAKPARKNPRELAAASSRGFLRAGLASSMARLVARSP